MKNKLMFAALFALTIPTGVLAQDADEAVAEAVARAEATPRPPLPQIRAVPTPRPPVAAYDNYDKSRDPRFDNYIDTRFVQIDYPHASVVAEEEGRVEVLLNVSADGELTNCEIAEPSEYERLNEATCPHIERRATFKPAKDDEGNPVAGEMRDVVYWRIRKPEFEEFSVHFTFTQSAAGEPLNCKLISLSGTPPKGMDAENPCKGFTSGSRLFRDENGVPVSKRVEIKIGASVTDVVETED